MFEQDSQERQEALEKARSVMDSEEIAAVALAVLEDKKGLNPVCICIEKVSTIGDYILVVTGTSTTHVRVMGETLRMILTKRGIELLNPGEVSDSTWTLLDFGSVIVHCMNLECREKYRLEEMWKEGKTVDPADLLQKYPCGLSI